MLFFPRHINNISKETEVLLRKMLVSSPSMRIDWEELFNYNFNYINITKVETATKVES